MFKRSLIALACLSCFVGNLPAADDPLTQAVGDANAKFYAALNAMFVGNLGPMQAVWSHAEDVSYLGPDGSYLLGWDATLKDWKKQADMNLGGHVQPQEIRITVGRDLAIVHNYEVGENKIDGNLTKFKIRATNIFRKENGAWKMIGHHTDILSFLHK